MSIRLLLFALILLLGAFRAHAQLTPAQEKLKEWAMIYEKYGTWPSQVVFTSNAKNEKDLLAEVANEDHSMQAVWAANGKDPLVLDFLNAARRALTECKLDTKLQQLAPQKWDYLNHNFYKTRIIAVPFNLCQDSSSNCSFESSFAAKNFPDLKLIVVNAYRWNMMSTADKAALAIHEFMGIIGLEEGTYGFSSNVHFVWVSHAYANGGIESALVCVPNP